MPDPDRISAEPTKTFFVGMLVRDIPLEQAILDLVDNCVDGAKRSRPSGDFSGLEVRIAFDSDRFEITDNCGGFSRDVARDYAFRFGRPKEAKRTTHSIGQFGVGMKRALFKFGDHFTVESRTENDHWFVAVDVPLWENQDDWHFEWSDLANRSFPLSENSVGTKIVVSNLHQEVAHKFKTKVFESSIIESLKTKHRQFIALGLSIRVNGNSVIARDISFIFDRRNIEPSVDSFQLKLGLSTIKIKIICGISESSPTRAGWYVICNGRVVLDADRSRNTGWGALEDGKNGVIIPSFHNQFARFRGVVMFDADDSSVVPWNTTKDGVDRDNPAWVAAFERMNEMSRAVIDFLNDLDADVDEHSRDHSALFQYVEKSERISLERIPNRRTDLKVPSRVAFADKVVTMKIQYSKNKKDVEFLKDQLGVGSGVAVGETTFDMVLRQFK